MKSLILYDSIGGNTDKIAQRINDTLNGKISEVDFIKIASKTDVDFFAYDLVFFRFSRH